MPRQGAKLSNPLSGITTLGDSQTHGPGWVDTLEASIGEVIHNEGQSSAKVGWALEFDKDDMDTTPNTTFSSINVWSRRKSRLYIVWFGLNDSATSYLGPETSEEVREQTFHERLQRVCRICNSRGGALVALLATQQYGPSYTDYVSRNDKTDRYDAHKVAIANVLPYVTFIPETGFLMTADDHNASNDLHFTNDGHDKMAAAVETGLSNAGLLLS